MKNGFSMVSKGCAFFFAGGELQSRRRKNLAIDDFIPQFLFGVERHRPRYGNTLFAFVEQVEHPSSTVSLRPGTFGVLHQESEAHAC